MDYNKLKDYLKQTEIIRINEHFHIRVSKELLEKYQNNLYNTSIKKFKNIINEIDQLNIIYPHKEQPIFFLYVVPDENFRELLNFPKERNYPGGAKPVPSIDKESFNSALGISSNILKNKSNATVSQIVNHIHEFSHLVQSKFFYKNRYLSEGFAEVLPLYILDYESRFSEHKNLLKKLEKENIYSAQELIELENKNNFNQKPLLKNHSCSFELPYISSYLFVRGCIRAIEKKYSLDKNKAMQKFLDILNNCKSINQFLVFEIADIIGIDKEELLTGKDMQYNILNEL